MTASDSIAGTRVAWRAIVPIAVLALAIHLLTAPRYGYFRDEFYILACGRHLDWGYVDHAPLVGLIARLTEITLGTSLYALRFVTGLSAAAKIVLTALLARELCGNRLAQAIAAFSVLLVPVYLVIDNQFSLNTWDPLFWMGTLLVILIAERTSRPRLLLLAGVLAGLGVENKHSTAFFLVALCVGIVLSPTRRLFREPYFYASLVLAFVLILPNLIWQWAHNFPTLEFLHEVDRTHKNVELPPLKFVTTQLMMMSPVNVLVWVPGLYFLLRRREVRFAGITFVAVFLLLMALHGKDYYVAPIYPILFAAGAVFWSTTRWPLWLPIILLIGNLPIVPAALPVLDPTKVSSYLRTLGLAPDKTESKQDSALPPYFSDQFGWPQMAEAARTTYFSLPPEEQPNTAFYTDNYGEAGALEFYGLPRVLSAHNTYWYWGQGSSPSTLILLNAGGGLIREGYCTVVTDGPEVGDPLAMSYERFRIRVCHGLKHPLPELWPRLKHWR